MGTKRDRKENWTTGTLVQRAVIQGPNIWFKKKRKI